jgi:hypothetical protein
MAVALLAVGMVVGLGRTTSAGAAESSVGEKARAEQVARGFLDAYGDFDADRAMRFLTTRAVVAEWGSPAKLRIELSLLAASGWKQTIRDPRMPAPPEGSDGCDAYDFVAYKGRLPAGHVIVYCTYLYHGLGSDELRRGPYGDAYWAILVDDGRIVSAENRIERTKFSAFEYQTWRPFRRWVSSAYPRDAAAMYQDRRGATWKRSEASVRLWEQHRREYVAAGAPYIGRVETICAAAHDRLDAMVGPPPETGSLDGYSRGYNPAAALVLQETLTELRELPPPEPFRGDFAYAYSLGDRLVRQLRGEVGDAAVIHSLGALGMHECTFDLPR